MVYLIIMLPYYSHVVPTFCFTSHLRKEGNQVIYANHETLKKLINAEGFYFENFNFLVDYKFKNLKTFFLLFFTTMFNKKFTLNRYRNFLNFSNEVDYLIKKTNPDTIYLDEYISEYYLDIFKHKKSVIILNTRFSTLKKFNSPPLNSSYIPKNNIFSTLFCEFLWSKHLLILKLEEILNEICFLGNSTLTFFKKKNRKYFYDISKIISNNHCLNRSINNVLTINLVPKFLEFLNLSESENEKYFYEPYSLKINIADQSIISLVTDLQNKKINRQKIILITFGTLYQSEIQKIRKFLNKIQVIAKNNKNYFFILSCEFEIESLDNFKLYKNLPLGALFKYIDLVINHGGIGTIKECISNNLPMLILPLKKNTDQYGCGARLHYYNFGFTNKINSITIENLQNNIQYLLNYTK